MLTPGYSRQLSNPVILGQILVILLFVFDAMAVADDLKPHTQSCTQRPAVIVQTPQAETLPEICGAAIKALEFLEHFNLFPQRDIYLHITEENIASGEYIAFGSYDSRSDQISLMSYPAIMSESRSPEMYREPFDKIHYSGAIAHEIAHAVVQHNLKVKLLSTSAQEYLAHATQLAVLPADRRRTIITAMNVNAWESGDLISDAYMAMEPGKFAVKSYLHLLSLQDPAYFIDILLNSKWFYISVP